MADDQKTVPESDFLRVKSLKESAELRANTAESRVAELETTATSTNKELQDLRNWKASNQPVVLEVAQLKTDLASSKELVGTLEENVISNITKSARELGISESDLEGKTVSQIELLMIGARSIKGESSNGDDSSTSDSNIDSETSGDGESRDENPNTNEGINFAKIGGNPEKSAVAQSRYFVGGTNGGQANVPANDREYAGAQRERSLARQADRTANKV